MPEEEEGAAGARVGAIARPFQTLNAFLSHYYPFSFGGSLLFAVGIYLLGVSIVGKNAYAFVICFAILFTLLVLGAAARVQAARLEHSVISWDTAKPLYAREAGQSHRVRIDGPSPVLFFRVHVRLRGRLTVAERIALSYFRNVASETTDSIEIPLVFPSTGVLRYAARTAVSDVFGLVRAPFGHRIQHTFEIQPALFPGGEIPPVHAAGGDKETSRTRQPDEERYYMREYVPGDRFRDINWKASTRLSELYTRISPVTQEQTQLITVYFRHFREPLAGGRRDSAEGIAHLDYLKSWLVAYLFQVKADHPEYHFRVVSGPGEALVETEDDIHALSRALASLYLTAEPPDYGRNEGDGALHGPSAASTGTAERAKSAASADSTVFSTALDSGLSAFLVTLGAADITLYRTSFASGESDAVELEAFPFGPLATFASVLPTAPFPLREPDSKRKHAVRAGGRSVDRPIVFKT